MEVTIPELDYLHKTMQNLGYKVFYGLVSMGLVIGLSIIVSMSHELLEEWISVILIVGIVTLLFTVLKGMIGSNNRE
jgi:hypothetical protein